MIYFDFVLALLLSTTKIEFVLHFSVSELNNHLSYSHTEILHLGVAVVWLGQFLTSHYRGPGLVPSQYV